jgi:hypothetical protein
VLLENAREQTVYLNSSWVIGDKPLVPTCHAMPVRAIRTQKAATRNCLTTIDHFPAFFIWAPANNPTHILAATLGAALGLLQWREI